MAYIKPQSVSSFSTDSPQIVHGPKAKVLKKSDGEPVYRTL